MKKFISSILLGTMIFTSVAFASDVTERSDIELVVNGKTIVNENVPIIVNSRTLIPLRDLVTNLGVPDDNEHIVWNGEARTVTITNDGILINLTIDSDVATVNGNEVKLDAPAMIYNSRTYIPARFVGEALNKKIGWDNYDSKVLVRDMEIYNEVKDTIAQSIKVMNDMKRFKSTVSIDTGYQKSGSMMKIKTYMEVDISNEKLYAVAEGEFMGMLSTTEQYYSDGKYYTLNEKGEWVVALEDRPFESLAGYMEEIEQIDVSDETIYDILTIDHNKTNNQVLVLRNDIDYKGILEQVSGLNSTNTDSEISEMLKNIKNLTIEYIINKETKCVESLKTSILAREEEVDDDMYMNVSLTIDQFNEDFTVYSPIK